MKIPSTPPDFNKNIKELFSDHKALPKILSIISSLDSKGRYLHWDKIRYIDFPELKNFKKEHIWAAIKLSRKQMYTKLPFVSIDGELFQFCMPSNVLEKLHWLDMHTAGSIRSETPIANPHMKNTYLIRSLIEEAISSSQLEGASTTRHVAKEMLRKKRAPKDKSEQMIFNNYRALQFIKENKEENLTPEFICELHRILTESTFENDNMSGVFRTSNDNVDVISEIDGEILHTPPPSKELKKRVKRICKFANEELSKEFIHPIIRAITLHFMLAYDHPFIDGNGRTARALFYWAMVRKGYWITEFISISRIIKRAPIKYGTAFLHTETDDNDTTYFILHQLDVITKAVDELFKYLENKMDEIRQAELLLYKSNLKNTLNFRQLSLLRHSLKHPRFVYNIQGHQNTHGISYETARKDLITMAEDYKLLIKLKMNKSFVFMAPEDLEERLRQ